MGLLPGNFIDNSNSQVKSITEHQKHVLLQSNLRNKFNIRTASHIPFLDKILIIAYQKLN